MHIEYRIALAVRIRANPLGTALPFMCGCGTGADGTTRFEQSSNFIEHVLRCNKASKFMMLHRHDYVLNALFDTVRRYGINATKEPGWYEYPDGSNNRPDITFHTVPQIVTDVTIVTPDELLGAAATAARRAKIEKHYRAVRAFGHHFYAFAMEVYGHFDKEAHTLINALAKSVEEWRRRDFVRDVHHECSVALVRGMAATFTSTHMMQNRIYNYMFR